MLKFMPKGSMCASCNYRDWDCSELAFENMMVIGEYEGTKIVKCENFESIPVDDIHTKYLEIRQAYNSVCSYVDQVSADLDNATLRKYDLFTQLGELEAKLCPGCASGGKCRTPKCKRLV